MAHELDVIQHVKPAYYGKLKVKHLRGVTRQSVMKLEIHSRALQDSFDQKMVTCNEVLYMEVAFVGSQKAESDVKLAKAKLNTLLIHDINTQVAPEAIPFLLAVEPTLEICLKTAEEKHPEIRLNEIKVQQTYDAAVGYGRDMFRDRIWLEDKDTYQKVQVARQQVAVVEKSVTQDEENYRINSALQGAVGDQQYRCSERPDPACQDQDRSHQCFDRLSEQPCRARKGHGEGDHAIRR